MINQYNKLIEEIVKEFAKRYYKEIYDEEVERSDYDIMNYVWISWGPVELNDMYLDINDILIAELYQIPCEIYKNYYYESLDAWMEWKTLWINLYNYFRKKTNPELYKKQETESIKQSLENLRIVKKELENLITKK